MSRLAADISPHLEEPSPHCCDRCDNRLKYGTRSRLTAARAPPPTCPRKAGRLGQSRPPDMAYRPSSVVKRATVGAAPLPESPRAAATAAATAAQQYTQLSSTASRPMPAAMYELPLPAMQHAVVSSQSGSSARPVVARRAFLLHRGAHGSRRPTPASSSAATSSGSSPAEEQPPIDTT